jgi:hypothetical protein
MKIVCSRRRSWLCRCSLSVHHHNQQVYVPRRAKIIRKKSYIPENKKLGLGPPSLDRGFRPGGNRSLIAMASSNPRASWSFAFAVRSRRCSKWLVEVGGTGFFRSRAADPSKVKAIEPLRSRLVTAVAMLSRQPSFTCIGDWRQPNDFRPTPNQGAG